MTKRFMIDDAGTLIDMQTRDTYDYVSDVCGLLNELTEENEQLKKGIRFSDYEGYGRSKDGQIEEILKKLDEDKKND